MDHDWLLVETLGDEPAVVAQGSATQNLVPISTFLRRNPHLMAIQSAIGETVRGGQPLTSITSKHDRVIRTAVVRMSDGVIHGVQLWIGPPDIEAPPPPVIGPLKWDLDSGVATDTPESLANSGRDAAREATHGRAFAEDLPARTLHPEELRVLSMVIQAKPGNVMCSTWNVTDYRGRPVAVGFVARAVLEAQEDGTERLICRSMNWRAERAEPPARPDELAQRILNAMATPGVHRALVDLNTWRLLKWLDDPCPFYDWRAGDGDIPMLDPADEHHILSMTQEFAVGPTTRVLGLRAHGGGYTPIHVTATRVELDENTAAALVALRVPTDEELAAAQQGAVVAHDPGEVSTRASLKSILRLGKADDAAD